MVICEYAIKVPEGMNSLRRSTKWKSCWDIPQTICEEWKVYLTCYQEAEKRHDQKRMDSFVSFIDDLREQIHELKWRNGMRISLYGGFHTNIHDLWVSGNCCHNCIAIITVYHYTLYSRSKIILGRRWYRWVCRQKLQDLTVLWRSSIERKGRQTILSLNL